MIIILIFLFTLTLYLLQRKVYISNCFKKVTADISFNISGIFEGEKVELIGVFFNKKLMPIWWLGIKYNVSRYLIFNDEKNENEGNDNFKKDLFFLTSYEKITKNYKITASKRGYYIVNEIELSSGDIFGDYRVIKVFPCKAHLYVYPKLIDKIEIDISLNRMTGEILTKRHIIEDPFQQRGIREYSSFDSLKMVNWNATARSGDLKVNQYDYTSSGEVTIFLNVERYNSWDPEKTVEECISIAATLATEYIKLGITVEVITNGSDAVSGEPIATATGNNMAHNIDVYEDLARIDIHKITKPIAEVMQNELNAIRKRKVIILISHYFGEGVIEEFKEASAQGFDIMWVLPKDPSTKVTIENMDKVFIWEVREK